MVDDGGLPTMGMGEGAHDGKTEPGTGSGTCAVTPGEAIEGAIDDVSGEPWTLVRHVEGDRVRQPVAA
jgi:hypothetical protein